MNFNKKNALAWAIAATLGGLSSQAGAVVYVGVTGQTNTPAKYVKEQDLGTIAAYRNFGFANTNQNSPSGVLTIQFPVIPSYKVTATDYLFVKIALTGGARFAAEPRLVCKGSGSNSWSGVAGVTNTAKAVIIGPTSAAANQSVANFLLASGFKTFPSNGASGGCYLAVSGSANPSYVITTRSAIGISAVVGYRFAGVPATVTRNGKFITFQSALVPTVQVFTFAGNTVANVVVDAKQGTQNFDPAVTKPASTTTAYLGSIRIGLSTALLRRSNTAATTVTVADILSTITVKMNGEPLAGAATVYLTNNANSATLCQGSFISTKLTNTTAVTFSTANISKFAAASGVNICMTVDGKKNISAGQITANLLGSGQTNYQINFPTTDYNLVEVKQNGASLTVLNIAHPTSSDQSYVRFYNGGIRAGAVRGTLYSQAGAIFGDENTIIVPSLAPHAVQVVSATDLRNLFPAWESGRAWLRVDAEIDQALFTVQALVRDPTGKLVNLSGQVVRDP